MNVVLTGKDQGMRRLKELRNCIIVCAAFVFGCSEKTQQERPNVVLIMADDLGFSDIGCFGGEIATPNLDRLASQGIRFSQFYSAARCCPTRASLLTGRYPHAVGMGGMTSKVGKKRPEGPYQGYLASDALTVAEALQEAGYATYMSGKWHVGEDPDVWPRQRGFERYFGLIGGANSYFELSKGDTRIRQIVLEDSLWEPRDSSFYMTDAITDYAIDVLKDHRWGGTNPFFMYVAYTAPHFPLHALPEDIERYRSFYEIGWDSLRILRDRKLRALGILGYDYELSPRTSRVPAWSSLTAEEKKLWVDRMTVYAAMVDRLDQGIGRLLQALENLGFAENTLVMFISDNGASPESVLKRGLHDPTAPPGSRRTYDAYEEPWANASNTPFRWYKVTVHEGGIASPFIARWPGIIEKKGEIVPQVAHVMDLLPTILDVTGSVFPKERDGKPVEPPDGISFAPAFGGKMFTRSQPIFWEHEGNRAVREGSWKLVALKGGEWELYDLSRDRTELHDLSASMPEKAQELRAKYESWSGRVGVNSAAAGGDQKEQ